MILSGPLIQKSRLFYLTAAATAKERIWAAQSGVTFHSGGCIKENAMAVGACRTGIGRSSSGAGGVWGSFPDRVIFFVPFAHFGESGKRPINWGFV